MTAPLTFTLPGARRRGSGAGPDDSGGRPEGVQEGQRLLPHHADTRDHRAKVADQQGNLALHDPGSSRVLLTWQMTPSRHLCVIMSNFAYLILINLLGAEADARRVGHSHS